MDKKLLGLGVSPGIVTGKAKIFSRDMAFQEGDILVTRMTDPTMVPIMAKALGILCEIGGMTSHPSIVSRELGIPCVVAIKDLFKQIQNNQKITFNGSTGEVFLDAEKGNAHCKEIPIPIPEGGASDEPDLKRFIKTMVNAFGTMDLTTLEPMSNFIFEPLFDKEWIARLEEAIDLTEKNNLSMEELSGKIQGLSMLRCNFFYTLLNLKSAHIKKERRLKIAHFFMDLYNYKSLSNHPYKNIMHSEKEIDHIRSRDFGLANRKIAKLLGHMYMAAARLSDGLYTDSYTDFSSEYFGPYKVDHQTLVIKQFKDLRPLELWEENSSPCKTLTIYCLYDAGVRFATDAIACHSYYTGDPITSLAGFRVEADGKHLSLDEVNQFTKELELEAVNQWNRLISLDRESLKLKGLQIKCYTLKELFEFLGINWKPDAAMIDAVKNKDFALMQWQPPINRKSEYWMKVADPAIDFYG